MKGPFDSLSLFSIKAFKDIFNKLKTSTDINDISRYEDLLIVQIISIICLSGSVLNFVVRMIVWHDNISSILVSSLLLFVLSLCLIYVANNIKKNALRVHLISVITIAILLTVSISYYFRINIIIFTVIFLVLLISIIRVDQILFAFIGVFGILVCIFLFIFKNNTTIELNSLYFILQISIFIMVLVIGFLISRMNKLRFLHKHDLYLETLKLSEEKTASEIALKYKNQKLQEYNKEIKSKQEKLNYMAYNDTLTKIPNRKYIMEKIDFLINLSSENNSTFAVVFIDIDDFKKINDTMGHHIGDKFLIEIASKLSNSLEAQDTVGRLGGDEFALIIQQNYQNGQLYEYVEKIRKTICTTYSIDDNPIYCSASLGISIYPNDATNVTDLLKLADTAMYMAKAKGKNNIQFFRKEMQEEVLIKLELEHELLDAINKNEFYLVYQPQIMVTKNKIRGFEALLRWNSPKRGIVSPDIFIPALEEMGQIIKVGDWVSEESCKKIKEIESLYNDDFHISINVSPLQIKNNNYYEKVETLIKKYDINPQNLELEITENIFINNLEEAINEINKLKKLGILIALDDFGTGYSSLNYLRRLPIDVLKIDKSFIWELEKGESERKMVGSIIDLVHDMDITVVAEGVETNYQFDYLKNEDCDHIQGYLFSKPVEESHMKQMLQNEIKKPKATNTLGHIPENN